MTGTRERPPLATALAGRAAHEIKLVGDVDQLTRSQLPTAHGQPVGQVRRFHPILAAPQRVLDRVKGAPQEESLIARVVPVRPRLPAPFRPPRTHRPPPPHPPLPN